MRSGLNCPGALVSRQRLSKGSRTGGWRHGSEGWRATWVRGRLMLTVRADGCACEIGLVVIAGSGGWSGGVVRSSSAFLPDLRTSRAWPKSGESVSCGSWARCSHRSVGRALVARRAVAQRGNAVSTWPRADTQAGSSNLICAAYTKRQAGRTVQSDIPSRCGCRVQIADCRCCHCDLSPSPSPSLSQPNPRHDAADGPTIGAPSGRSKAGLCLISEPSVSGPGPPADHDARHRQRVLIPGRGKELQRAEAVVSGGMAPKKQRDWVRAVGLVTRAPTVFPVVALGPACETGMEGDGADGPWERCDRELEAGTTAWRALPAVLQILEHAAHDTPADALWLARLIGPCSGGAWQGPPRSHMVLLSRAACIYVSSSLRYGRAQSTAACSLSRCV